MLQQPMMEKLHALKLQGLLEALERQEQDETARELSFLEIAWHCWSISSGTGDRTRLSPGEFAPLV
jgi:hypothetical protein